MAWGKKLRPKFYLPEDVTANILSRLPVKSLLRFKCLCKEWHTLISSSYFTSMHLNHSISNPSRQSILFHHYSPSKFIPFDPVTFSPRTNYFNLCLDQVPSNIEDDMRVVGSINGVLCITTLSSSGWVCVWNPAAKMFRKIRTGVTSEFNFISIGFGFDPIVEDYKVVLIYSSISEWPVATETRLKVWSAKLESWRNMKIDSKFMPLERVCSAIVNEFAYWIVRDLELVDRVASFNMNTEVLQLVPTPSISDPTYELHRYEYCYHAFMWKENFALAIFDQRNNQFQAWTMENDTLGKKEYWREIFTFRLEPPFLPI